MAADGGCRDARPAADAQACSSGVWPLGPVVPVHGVPLPTQAQKLAERFFPLTRLDEAYA